MIFKIIVALLLVVFIVAIIVATRPDTFRYTRSATILAPPSVIFDHVNNLHLWNAWSPWARLDPNAKYSLEGPEAGEGAVMRWDGNNNVGAGSMTIIESRPHERLRMRLEFLRPFQATHTAEFVFTPQGDHTLVTWSMYGNNTFLSKAMGMVVNCDKMCGQQFEKGLAQLNEVVVAGVK